MIELTHRAIKGRVARRVFLLFVLSAFVPLALIAALSITQLRQSILSQGDRRLATAGKEFGMAVFDRLQVAADSAASAAELTGRQRRGKSIATRHFRSLGTMDPRLGVRSLMGEVRPLSLTVGARQRLAEGKNALVVDGPSVLLLVPAGDAQSARILFGELHPEYLWGTQELQPTAIDIASSIATPDPSCFARRRYPKRY
jgi:hypothetical protein